MAVNKIASVQMASTGVSAATYTNPSITVDLAGRITAASSGTAVNKPTTSDKFRNPITPGTGDSAYSGLTITAAPTGGGYVVCMVNGVAYELGDGVKTKDCFFSGDNGTTARAFSAIAAGDKFYWNGVVTGFDLLTTYCVTFLYNV